jgi:hypothetical protein
MDTDTERLDSVDKDLRHVRGLLGAAGFLLYDIQIQGAPLPEWRAAQIQRVAGLIYRALLDLEGLCADVGAAPPPSGRDGQAPQR